MQADSLLSEPLGKLKNTGMGSLSLLQGIFPAQESNQDLLHCRQILYQLSYQGIPVCFLLLPNNIPLYVCISSVQLLSHVRLFATPWTAARQASMSITNSRSLLRLMSIELMMPSNHLILCCPLLLLPSIFPSIRIFSNESVLHIRWPKDWSFSFSISPSSEHSGLIPFRMDCFVFPAVQGTLKSILQHHNSKASICRCSAFFIVQLSHSFMTKKP